MHQHFADFRSPFSHFAKYELNSIFVTCRLLSFRFCQIACASCKMLSFSNSACTAHLPQIAAKCNCSRGRARAIAFALTRNRVIVSQMISIANAIADADQLEKAYARVCLFVVVVVVFLFSSFYESNSHSDSFHSSVVAERERVGITRSAASVFLAFMTSWL